jgi:adenine-specific DNA-methyltransferase
MERLKMHSPDFAEENIARLAALFPNCVTESVDEKGTLKKTIDFDLLRQELSTHIVEGPRERYHLNWPGKREALLAANAPIAKTLRPCREESVDFDTTENLFIEGDNLDALKLLQQTYLGKIKMIYIDPPYNTGNDFIYADNFAESTEEYLIESEQKDEEGNRLIANTDANGRFHSDWLSMMYSRLKLARNLLRDDGIIMVSIGENELHNAKKLCDEIYGQQNFILNFSRMMKSGGAKGKFYTPSIDYILVYAKSIDLAEYFRKPLTKEQIDRFYNKVEISGPRNGEIYGEERLYKASLDHRPNQRYYIQCPDGSFVIPPGKNFPKTVLQGEKILPTSEDGVWKWIFERYKNEFEQGNIIFKKTNTSALVDEKGNKSCWNIYNKLWLKEQQDKGAVPSNFIGEFENRKSSAELSAMDIPFNFAKPSSLLKYLINLVKTRGHDIVLDFFAGSSTTAHAVMQLNSEDGGKRKFIMVQLPEPCDEKSEAFKAGYKTIAEIGKERIRRAGKKIIEENAVTAQGLDIGFRVLKVDSSNMVDVYYTPDAVGQDDLLQYMDNIKDDRSGQDLLFQVLLDWGVGLSLPVKKEIIGENEVFIVNPLEHVSPELVACFAKNGQVTEKFCKELAKRQPLRVVFRDAGFKDDSVKINVEQIFKLMSPQTEVKTI